MGLRELASQRGPRHHALVGADAPWKAKQGASLALGGGLVPFLLTAFLGGLASRLTPP